MLVRYFDDMTKRSDDFFGSIFSDIFGSAWRVTETSKTTPTVQVHAGPGLRGYRTLSDKDGLSLEIDLPGIAPKDVSLWSSGNQLIVKAQRGEQKFTNRYTISEEYDVNTAKASMAHGQLKITISKTAELDTKRINIEIG